MRGNSTNDDPNIAVSMTSSDMGASASKPAGGIVVTLDALGTLYRFREPVAVQYQKVAQQCGLNVDIDPSRLEASFKSSFKHHSNAFPNYGRTKLSDPSQWWNVVVKRAFADVVDPEKIPSDLGDRLYTHFSSGAAYELYPDVQPFLNTLRVLREQFFHPDGHMIILGIMTNSDPRVREVLRSFSLRIGPSQLPSTDFAEIRAQSMKNASTMAESGHGRVKSPWYDFYNSQNDFDFLTTSYEAGFEKPDPGIFLAARRLASPMPMSRAEQCTEVSGSVFGAASAMARATFGHASQVKRMTWIHVGDEYLKDYLGAKNAGMEALHLVREGEGSPRKDTESVANLEEVAAIVNLMAQENLR